MSSDVGYGSATTRSRILTAAWDLISKQGAAIKLSDVGAAAGVSRQAVYLHFGDRSGLLLALVEHMDNTLDLGSALAHVQAAPDGAELITRLMRLNTEFWTTVAPIAQILEAAQHDDEAARNAWRDRMQFRQAVFTGVAVRLVELDALSPDWTPERAATVIYATAHFDTWRELVDTFGWSDDDYVDAMTLLLRKALLVV